MKPNDLGAMWLRDRAKELREAAVRVDSAYTEVGVFANVCGVVAEAYLKAAADLEAAAHDLSPQN